MTHDDKIKDLAFAVINEYRCARTSSRGLPATPPRARRRAGGIAHLIMMDHPRRGNRSASRRPASTVGS
jgi:hypothetical protein